MDEDGETESQSLAVPPPLSWWMMKSLWHLRLSVANTFLLEEGHLLHWFFTSNSGHVLKRANKRLDWDELVKFLVRRARGTWGTRADAWTPGVIATARRLKGGQAYAVMLTAADLKAVREKHNAHLLDEIVVIQPYLTRKQFGGCGLFETEFERTGRHRAAQAVLATFELARWPREDVKWFEDFEPCANAPEGRGGARKSRDSSAERVYGVLHRMLAATTKSIVEHVENQTGEVILRVVAQYVFSPGSGQPTLLWLDSVDTRRSTEHLDRTKKARRSSSSSSSAADDAFARLTHDLGESEDRAWTTFFPPKLAELAGGGTPDDTSAASGLPFSGSGPRTYHPHSGGKGSKLTSRLSPALFSVPATSASPEEPTEGTLSPARHDARDVFLEPQIALNAPGGVDDTTTSVPVEEVHLFEHTGRRADGGQRRCFALPTESWAHRSAGWRGLYFSGMGGDGRGERPSSEQWPRRRSTATTMRVDGRRPDLRSKSETERPWTAPARVVERADGWARGAGRGSRCGTINHRLDGRTNGCYGDYCHCQDLLWSSHTTTTTSGGSGGLGAGSDDSGAPASKLLSYRSILKCRAEEKALSLAVEMGTQEGDRGSWRLATLESSRETEAQPTNRIEEDQGKQLDSLVAERMRLLATNLSDQGCGEYYHLRSIDRRTAGAPESAQHAMGEMLYEEALSHLHPTTISRPVTVCDTCAMVYGSMDAYRKQTKRLASVASHNSRAARFAWRRQEDLLRQQQRQQRGDRHRPRTAAAEPNASPLRRYTNLNRGEEAPGPAKLKI